MKRTRIVSWLLTLLTVAPIQGWAQVNEATEGQVQIPIEVYRSLIEQSQAIKNPAPVNHALGKANVTVTVPQTAPSVSAQVQVTLSIEIFEDEWVLVPILPPGTAVDQALVQGSPVQLVSSPGGLSWSTNKAGSYQMSLSYRTDAFSSASGYVLSLPLPQAASTSLTASLPGTGLDVAVIPAAGTTVTTGGKQTIVRATIPATNGVQLSWRTAAERGASFSRAHYRGELQESAIVWRGELEVELFGNESVRIAFLPRTATLNNVLVDGKTAPILVENKRFATIVSGEGTHRLAIVFEVPVEQAEGPPGVKLDVPRVPVSRFDLTLPGRKEVATTPASSVTSRIRGGATVATAHLPMTSSVAFSWSEAVPESTRAELRSNASIHHAIHAEEGILIVRAYLLYDVRRGETNRLELEVPEGVQVNEVIAPNGAVADWRVEPRGAGRVLRVFLDRQVKGELWLEVSYDRALITPEAEELPLLSALDVQRQRGMVALLSTRELTLDPTEEAEAAATRVGENQLPPSVRDSIEKTVAHTFKYADAPPSIVVAAVAPERVAAKFDAIVDTLVSLGEVTLTGTTSVEVDVKSGGLDRLELVLPEGTDLLNLTAPSLRSHRPSEDDATVTLLEFTQELEGQFRLELSYERILTDEATELDIPMVRVRAAEVEQGRIAVEALSAVEVQPAATEQLSAIDVGELPRQLVLRTTNPILHAFKYSRAEPTPQLTLRVDRHQVVGVQEAVIDEAGYRSLFTRDGLTVTTARFTVRNARKQFLRVDLPPGSEVWSVFVAGRAEKPALTDEPEGGGSSYLIRIVNSTAGFPVELTYATRGTAIGRLGSVRARLPRPDILVTESRWDVFLPDGLRYGEPVTNLDLLSARGRVSGDEMGQALESAAGSEALQIKVPSTGIHFAFEKLYANQAAVEARIRIPYASAGGVALGQLASLLGVLLLAAGAVAHLTETRFFGPRRVVAARAAMAAGVLILVVAIGFYGVSAVPSLLLSLLLGGGALVRYAKPRLDRWKSRFKPDEVSSNG